MLGSAKRLLIFSLTALWYTFGLPPVDLRFVLVCDPEGKCRLETLFCTDPQTTLAHILRSAEVTLEGAEFVQLTREAFEFLINGLPVAA